MLRCARVSRTGSFSFQDSVFNQSNNSNPSSSVDQSHSVFTQSFSSPASSSTSTSIQSSSSSRGSPVRCSFRESRTDSSFSPHYSIPRDGPPTPHTLLELRVYEHLKYIRQFLLCTSPVALKKWTTDLKNLNFFLAVHCLHIHNHKSILQRYLCC